MSSPPTIDPSDIPALKPPPGITPNFVNAYTRGPMLLALSSVAIGIMYIFVITRFYYKFIVLHKLTWDDLTCLLAMLGTTGQFIGVAFLERAGLGTHQWNLRAVELIKDSFLVPLYILVNTQPLVALCLKLSFHIYFLQIFGPKSLYRWIIYVGAFVTTSFYVAATIVLFVLSTPRHGVTLAEQFTSFLSQKSSHVLVTTFALGYFHIFSDLYVLVLPIFGVIGLHLKPKRKFGVILIFMTGLLTLGASSASLYYRYLVNNSGDTTWNLMPAAYLTILEYTIGIDCFCMPAAFGAIRRHLPLFTTIRSHVASLLRTLGARFSSGARSSYLRFFGHSAARTSVENEDIEHRQESGEIFVLKKLPDIARGGYTMRTARSLIWGSKKDSVSITNDEETTLTNQRP